MGFNSGFKGLKSFT